MQKSSTSQGSKQQESKKINGIPENKLKSVKVAGAGNFTSPRNQRRPAHSYRNLGKSQKPWRSQKSRNSKTEIIENLRRPRKTRSPNK